MRKKAQLASGHISAALSEIDEMSTSSESEEWADANQPSVADS